jgi:hypothetical protein
MRMNIETEQELTKIKYEAPELVRHGDLEELTKGTVFRDTSGDTSSLLQ